MREKTIYEKIAKKYNTTPEEVRREMQIAIDAGFATTKLDIIKNEDREIIRIEYMLDINYTYVSDCTVEINIIYQ